MEIENGRLPEKFIERMKAQLPETEWESFFLEYSKKPWKGVRVNTLKCDVATFQKLSPFALSPVEWEETGFRVEEEKVGGNPYHFAGVFYSQEPSAMVAVPLLDVRVGERVLDLCSAPGGKGTQIASKLNGTGLIVLNEPVFARAKILSQNVERMGVKNAVVLSAMPSELALEFSGYFDKILVDAPCSGEGMFRKNAEEALSEWSEENVLKCAKRQTEILNSAVEMLKVGGKLVYSTCTFSTEEDEGQVREFLALHPEMRLLKQEKLYPHKIQGEGHFACLLEKTSGETVTPKRRDCKPFVSKATEKAYREFEAKFFKGRFAKNLHEVGRIVYALPDGVFDWKGLNVLRVGVRLGELVNGRFEPSHSLVMASKADEIKRIVNLQVDDLRVEKFLSGETIDYDIENGWCAVCVDGFPIGLGKAVNGVVKNHIPKGLRIK